MSKKNIILTATFILVTVALNAQTKFYIYKTDGTSVEFNINEVDSISFTPSLTLPILGEYTTSGCGFWDGAYSWNVTIRKDEPEDGKEPDPSKVWFYNFIEGGQNVGIYGIVNHDVTEIRIPMGQTTVITSGVQYAIMTGWHVFYHEDGTVNNDLDDDEYDIPDGYNMVIYIENDGQKMYLPPVYEFGSYIVGYPNNGLWYNILVPYPVPGGGILDYDMNRPMMTLIKK